MSDPIARRKEFTDALSSFLNEWPDVVSSLGTVQYVEAIDPDDITIDDIERCEQVPSYIGGWLLVVEHLPLDPAHSRDGSIAQTLTPDAQSPLYTVGLARHAS